MTPVPSRKAADRRLMPVRDRAVSVPFMDYLISIIIPCYNSGRFIASTVEMLFRQDMSGCELILVNDGSEDSTLSILRQYEAAHENIRVIDQPNKGVSVARNNGMLAARGKYIYFLDSDDTLTEDTLAHFKQVVTGHPDCQMFLFGYETRRNNAICKSYVSPQLDGQTFSGRVLQHNFLSKKLCCNICSCIYDRAFILENKLTLKPGLKIGEDVLFLMQLMFKADRVYYSARRSFIYQIRDDSTMRGYRSYSGSQYESYAEWMAFLLPIARQDLSMRNYVNFFLLFVYLSNLRYYLRSDVKSRELNERFIADGNIRYKKNFAGNIPCWVAMKATMLIPLKILLKLLK